jgi:mannose-6-phosphate isomerase-like protein (cupin superfamily)
MAFPDEVARKLGSGLTDSFQELVVIGPYDQVPATCNDHDPRTIEVAEQVGRLIEFYLSGIAVEHVGSTAVQGCVGKGIVDLMILYPPGRLPEVKDVLNALGFQGQTGSPRIVGELNGQHVKLVKFQGEFVWHKHDHEDELFLVVYGRFRMEYRDRHVWLKEGKFLIVPRGVEDRPVAEEEVYVLLLEPAGTLNTGDVRDEGTVQEPERI